MGAPYRRDYEHENSRGRSWGGGEHRSEQHGGISRETGWDRGGRGRDERDSRDWQQPVSDWQQGYRTRDPMFDRSDDRIREEISDRLMADTMWMPPRSRSK